MVNGGFEKVEGCVYRCDYDAVFGDIANKQIDEVGAYRWLCLNDLWFLVMFVMKVEGANHPFVVKMCNEVGKTNGDRELDLWARGHFKSSIITTAWVIQQILKDKEERIGIFSHTRPAAKSLLRRVKLIFEGSELLKACFPDVLYGNPESESPKWSEDDGLIVRREGYYNEGSIEAWGLIEGMPTGKHFTLRVYDDVETKDLVGNPDTIERLKDSFSLSHNLSSMDGRHRVIGTPYSHAGLLQYIRGMKYPDGRLMYKQRIVPITEDGTANGRPVYLSASAFDEMRARAGNDVREEYNFNCQQLLNPTPVGVQRFNPGFLKEIEHQFIPKDCYKFMVIDPAGDSKDGKGDAWAVLTVGVEPKADEIGASNIYIMDACISPMRDSEAIEQIVRMYMNGGLVMQIGIEKVGLSSVEVHVANALSAKGRSISVDAGSLRILRPAGRNKVKRIEQSLAWPFNNGKIYISKAVSSVYKERLRNEMEQFPYWHDDGLDALSYLYDMIKDCRFAWRVDYKPLKYAEMGVV